MSHIANSRLGRFAVAVALATMPVAVLAHHGTDAVKIVFEEERVCLFVQRGRADHAQWSAA